MTPHAAAGVVIPLLNQRDSWLTQCVLSGLHQTVPTEVLVVCSPRTSIGNRETLRALEEEHGMLRVLAQDGDGFAAAINQGFRSAGCERIGLLQSDDWLKPDAVERCLEYDSDIVSTAFTCFAENGIDEYESLAWDHRRPVYDTLATLEEKACYLSHFFLFRASKIREVGGLDETIGDAPGIDDYDFVWTLLERGATVSIVEERLYCYRDHGEQRLTLSDAAEQVRNLNRILAKHGVEAEEQERIVRSHSVWYGRPMHSVSMSERRDAVGNA